MDNDSYSSVNEILYITDEETLRRLSKSDNESVLKAVASNSSTPTDVLDALSSSEYTSVLVAVAGNWHTPSPVLLRLIDGGNREVLIAMARKAQWRNEVFDRLFALEDDEITSAIAMNFDIKHDTLRALATRSSPLVLRSIAFNVSTPPDVIRSFIYSEPNHLFNRSCQCIKCVSMVQHRDVFELYDVYEDEFLKYKSLFEMREEWFEIARIPLHERSSQQLQCVDSIIDLVHVTASKKTLQDIWDMSDYMMEYDKTTLSSNAHRMEQMCRFFAQNRSTPSDILHTIAQRYPDMIDFILQNENVSAETLEIGYQAQKFNMLLLNAAFPFERKAALEFLDKVTSVNPLRFFFDYEVLQHFTDTGTRSVDTEALSSYGDSIVFSSTSRIVLSAILYSERFWHTLSDEARTFIALQIGSRKVDLPPWIEM